MKNVKKKLAIILSTVLVVTALAGCQKKTETIKIAVAGPLTGDNAEYGTGFKNAVELMVEKWNKDGGVLGSKIEVVSYDDKNNGDEAATVAQKIVSDKDIKAVVGHFASGVSMAASPTYQESGLVEISPSASHPDYTKAGDFIFRNNSIINHEVKVALELATKTFGKSKIGVLSIKTDWGTKTADITKTLIKEAGLTLVDHQEVVEGTVDFSPNISKLNNAGAEVIIVVSMYNTLAPFASQYKAVNPNIQLVGFSNAYSKQLIELAKGNAENIHFPTSFFSGSTNPEIQEFVSSYKEKYGAEPSGLTAQAYDSAGMILTAIKNGNSADRKSIREQLAKIEYNGVTGKTTFDANRDSVKVFTKVKIENGKFVEVK